MNETMTSVYSHQYRVVYVKFAIVFMTMVKSMRSHSFVIIMRGKDRDVTSLSTLNTQLFFV